MDPQGENQRSPLSGIIGFDFYQDSRHIVDTRGAEDGSGIQEMRLRNLETGADGVLLRGPYAEMVVAPDGPRYLLR